MFVSDKPINPAPLVTKIFILPPAPSPLALHAPHQTYPLLLLFRQTYMLCPTPTAAAS